MSLNFVTQLTKTLSVCIKNWLHNLKNSLFHFSQSLHVRFRFSIFFILLSTNPINFRPFFILSNLMLPSLFFVYVFLSLSVSLLAPFFLSFILSFFLTLASMFPFFFFLSCCLLAFFLFSFFRSFLDLFRYLFFHLAFYVFLSVIV